MKTPLTERSKRKLQSECYPALICQYYVYVLRHEQKSTFYYGSTADLSRRVAEHQQDGAWRLIYYEAYVSESDARTRERSLKHYGQARTYLQRRLQDSLKWETN